jgi:hypothetical protein
MKHYLITAQIKATPGKVFESFDLCQPFATEVSDILRQKGWGGGGGMRSDGEVINIDFYATEERLPEAMGEIRAGMARKPFDWLVPSVSEIPEGALFECWVRNKWLCAECTTIEEFIQTYKDQAAMMEQWLADGIRLDPDSSIADDYALFVTDNIDAALKHNFMLVEADEEEELAEEWLIPGHPLMH